MALGMKRRIISTNLTLLDNYVLIGRYDKALSILPSLKGVHSKKKLLLRLTMTLHVGIIYKYLLRFYLFVKYGLLKSKF